MADELYEDNIKLVKKKIKRKNTKVIIIISILALICVIIACFVINHYYKSTKTISFDDYEVYQYFSGIKYNYTGKATLEDGVLTGINDKGKNYRINYFSKLEIEVSNSDEMAFIDYNNKKLYIRDSFLYDGKDMYIFPYSVTVTVENRTYELSPMSYVIVNYKDSVEMYDKKTDKFYLIDEINDDVMVSTSDKKINLSTDMIVYEDDERLLIKNVNKLNQFEG